ncbi:hypothetical protein WJX73_010042 [Symbiochloris irregularis]|uniref:Acyl carrier protein n=1 Tax=Symbiochloris irregularis TaxID=706552 RepID=A0AAW1NQ56_9CHLO
MVAPCAMRVSAPTVSRPASVSHPRLALRPAARPFTSRFVRHAADAGAVLKDVQSVIAEQLGKDLAEVGPEAKFVDLGADSLDTVEIMMALEEKFDLQMDEEGAEKISTVKEAADMITQQIDSK